jgi:hypothetical protein
MCWNANLLLAPKCRIPAEPGENSVTLEIEAQANFVHDIRRRIHAPSLRTNPGGGWRTLCTTRKVVRHPQLSPVPFGKSGCGIMRPREMSRKKIYRHVKSGPPAERRI